MKTAAMNVDLVDHMGTDLSVVNAARVSFDKGSEWEQWSVDGGKTITSAEYNAWLNSPLTKALKRSFEQSITDPENQPSQYGTVTLEMYEALEDQLAAAQEEIESNKAYFTTLLEEQRVLLAKAEQLWQVSKGRCDGLEEKLAKTEQRVAEWQPIETAPKDGQSYLAYSTEFVNQYWVTDKCNGMTHWMPLPKAPANGGNS